MTSSRPDSRQQLVTDTGWRVVGQAVSLVNELPISGQLPEGRAEDTLYIARFRVRPRLGGGSAVNRLLAVLGDALIREWEGAPPLTRDSSLARPPGRFHGVRWDTLGDAGAWTGELLWRHPHPVVAGAPCTTHVVIVEQGLHTELTVRVTADAGLASVRGPVGAGQARPAFLTEMNRTLVMSVEGVPSQPSRLDESEIDSFVRDVLLSDTRRTPVAVLAPLEGGGFALEPHELADELLGRAQLYVMPYHSATFRLTDSLGDRRLSCYWGALRFYMPEFSCADSPEEHPLLVHDRLLDPVIRAGVYGRLSREAAQWIAMPPGVAERRSPPVTTVEVPARPAGVTPEVGVEHESPADQGTPPVAELETGAAAAPGNALAPVGLLESLGARIASLTDSIARLAESNAQLADEIQRLHTTGSVRAASSTSLERRLASIERLLERTLPLAEHDEDRVRDAAGDVLTARSGADADAEADDAEDEDLTLLDVLRQAASTHTDALLVLDNAERAAADSPYEDVERVAVILDAMAVVARRRQAGALGNSLRQAFRDIGVEYRGGIAQSTSERMQQQYLITGPDGRSYDCREHIVLGTSYDPRHCLRIYFTSRAPVEPRFVIGHVGRHFEVKSSS